MQRNGEKIFACRARSALINLKENVRLHMEGMTTRMQASVDVFTKVACTLY